MPRKNKNVKLLFRYAKVLLVLETSKSIGLFFEILALYHKKDSNILEPLYFY